MASAVIICGGRNFTDYNTLRDELNNIHERLGMEIIIHGAETNGADGLADKWGRLKGLLVIPIPAWWQRYGNAAGPIRNGIMMKLLKIIPTERRAVIAFPGGHGTATMVALAERESETGIELIKVGW